MSGHKDEVITFKVDRETKALLDALPNRSAFIRSAVLRALDSVCPLCGGTGLLTPQQRAHWEAFSRTHVLRECEQCHAVHLVCLAEESPSPHAGGHG